MKHFKLALSLLKENIFNAFLILMEMAIGTIALGAFLSEGYILVSTESTFSDLELNKVIFSEGNPDYGEALQTFLKNSSDLLFLDEALPPLSFEYDGVIYNFYTASEPYIQTFYKMFDSEAASLLKAYPTENIVFLSPELKRNYHIGDTYTFELYYENKYYTITAYVGGFLKSGMNFWPDSFWNHFISQDYSGNILYLGKNPEIKAYLESLPIESHRYILYETDISMLKAHLDTLSFLDGYSNSFSLSLYMSIFEEQTASRMGIPLLIGIASIMLFVVAFSSYSLICIYQREKQYGLFFMHGASWRDCLYIQFLCDFVLLLIMYLLSFVCIYLIKSTRFYITLNPIGVGLSFFICSVLYFVFSALAASRMRKQKPIQIIRRWL